MTYVIIGILLLVVIVPIFSILPSKRQREQMAMRNAARAAGVSVELKTIDDPNPNQEKYISYTGRKIPAKLKVTGYRIQRRRQGDWRKLPEVDWCLIKKSDEGWVWVKDSEHLSTELKNFLQESKDTLPEDVIQVEEVSYNIVVYWHERTIGSEDNVLNFLQKCAELPLHHRFADEDSEDDF